MQVNHRNVGMKSHLYFDPFVRWAVLDGKPNHWCQQAQTPFALHAAV